MRTLLAAAALALATTPPATFVDPTGDAAGGDISTLTVEAVRDTYRFTIAVSPGTDLIRFWFDVDADARTGDDGFDVRLTIANVDGDLQASFERWLRSVGVWIDAPTPAHVRTQVLSAYTVEVPRVDVGYATTFGFAVTAGGYAPTGERAFDRAPDTGEFRFTARSHRIVLERSVGGVSLGLPSGEVKRVLGTPEEVRARVERYLWQRIVVRYRALRGRLVVASVTTTNRLDAAGRGIGVGSSAAAVRRLVSGVRCHPRACTRSSRAGTTTFGLAGGRVARITVAARS